MIKKIKHKYGFFQYPTPEGARDSWAKNIFNENSYWLELDTDTGETSLVYQDGNRKIVTDSYPPESVKEMLERGVWIVFDRIGYENIENRFPTISQLLEIKRFKCFGHDFELVEDDRGYILSKNGAAWRTYSYRAGDWQDILRDTLE